MKQIKFSKFMNMGLIILVLTTMLLFTSCSREGDSGQTPTFKPYIGGDSAIGMEFVEGMPPDVLGAILDSGKSSFSVGVKITNEGEHNINAESEGDFLQLRLKGIKSEYYGVDDSDLTLQLDEDLNAQRKNMDGSITRGDTIILSIDEMSYQSDIQGDLPVNFLMDICYDYSTKTSTLICVADDVNRALTSEQDQQICLINSVRDTINSGGPVHVINLRQAPMGGSKISVLFDISKVGEGDIFLYEGDNKCEYNIGSSDKDKVIVQVYLPEQSDSKIECSGFEANGNKLEKAVSVFDGSPTPITCKISGDEDGDDIYVETLNIDLFYRYNEQLKKSVVVQDAGSSD